MTDQPKYSCQGCTRDDLTLTKNGRVRSHAPNGKRVGPDNPACPEGSNWPVQSTEFHTHRFQYGDDGIHMAGSFCTVDDCGMAEPDDSTEVKSEMSTDIPAPPNPFRPPLPGGLHDNAQKAAPRAPRSADDFLDDDENDDAEDAVDNGPSYWPARYDGDCISCFAHFDAGDMIRRVDNGYEAQDCCGYGAEPDREEKPKAVARTLPVVNGRYQLPDPETGKKITGGRASKYAEGIADSFALDQWRHRMILIGLLQDPEILEKVASGVRDLDPLEAVKLRRAFLNARAEEAMLAAGSKKRAEKGTKLHKWTEEVDAGQRELEDVPEDYRPDATAYRLALAECGFRPVKDLIERSVYSSELGVSGTFDRVLECVRDTELLDLEGRTTVIHAGEFVIGDVKSGDNIKSPWLEILIQEAIYAHAVNENGVAVADPDASLGFRWVTLEELGAGKVREDVGVVMHVPYGSGECRFYPADLITGWRGAQLCKANRDFWKIELPQVPFATFAVTDVGSEIDYEVGEEPPSSTPEERDAAMAKILAGVPELCPGCHHEEHLGTCNVCGCFNGTEMAPDTPAEMILPDPPEPPKNIMEAVHRAKHADNGTPEIPKGIEWWERAFRSVTTREAANLMWREAKDAGIQPNEIKRLVSLVRLEDPKPQTPVSRPNSTVPVPPVQDAPKPPETPATPADGRSLTDRARTVTTKAEATAVFNEINAKIQTMPPDERPKAKEYRDKLVKIMQDRLAAV